MDGNNWRGGQVPMAQPQGGAVEQPALSSSGDAPPIDPDDWRAQLSLDSRHRIVNRIMETLKNHLPFSGQEGLQELEKIAVRFEEMIYSAATSQFDYLRKISLKMLTLVTKSQSPMANTLQTTASRNSSDLASLDSTAQTGNTGAGDWQEEVYQKIKSMKDMYLLEMNEMYVKIATKLQQYETLPQQPKNEQFDKLKFFKVVLERLVQFVQLSKNDIQISHKDRLGNVEKQIMSLLRGRLLKLNHEFSWSQPRKIASLKTGQLPQPHMPGMQNSQLQSQISHMQNSQLQPIDLNVKEEAQEEAH